MNETQAKRAVLVAMLVMGGYAVAKDVTGKGPSGVGGTYRQLWAVGALGLVLSMVADFAPQVAGPLALLAGLAFVLGGQGSIEAVVASATGVGGSAGGGTTKLGPPAPGRATAGPFP